MDRPNSSSTEPWSLLGNKIPKSEIVYFCQMSVVYIFIITFIVNLSPIYYIIPLHPCIYPQTTTNSITNKYDALAEVVQSGACFVLKP